MQFSAALTFKCFRVGSNLRGEGVAGLTTIFYQFYFIFSFQNMIHLGKYIVFNFQFIYLFCYHKYDHLFRTENY